MEIWPLHQVKLLLLVQNHQPLDLVEISLMLELDVEEEEALRVLLVLSGHSLTLAEIIESKDLAASISNFLNKGLHLFPRPTVLLLRKQILLEWVQCELLRLWPFVDIFLEIEVSLHPITLFVEAQQVVQIPLMLLSIQILLQIAPPDVLSLQLPQFLHLPVIVLWVKR